MKLKLDENLPHDLTADLAARGHDVHTVHDEQLAGHADPVVVRTASDEGRMVLTLDRGVGDLRRHPPGILVFGHPVVPGSLCSAAGCASL